jgi:hypothetical protein
MLKVMVGQANSLGSPSISRVSNNISGSLVHQLARCCAIILAFH